MFGKKVISKVEAAPEVADLEVNVGVPGFVQDKPQPAKEAAPAQSGIPGFGSIGAPLPQTPVVEEQKVVAAAVEAPAAPVPEPKGQYQVIGAELLPNGLYRYVVDTNKNLGEIGGVYEA